jgi:hypothetical protein
MFPDVRMALDSGHCAAIPARRSCAPRGDIITAHRVDKATRFGLGLRVIDRVWSTRKSNRALSA